MGFDLKKVLPCRCGGNPVIKDRTHICEEMTDRYAWLECDKCGMRSPEKEVTYNRESNLYEMAEVWNGAMYLVPPANFRMKNYHHEYR